MLRGHATEAGTRAYADRFASFPGFYREAQGLTVSTLGIGSYLGEMDEVADANYEQAFVAALRGGINFLDTSLNYRHQRSEQNIGAALAKSGVARDEIVICTKAGYLVPGAVPTGKIQPADVFGNMHCLAPAFLEDQISRSFANLGVDCVDVFYLHNPETQLPLGEDEFYARIHAAFEALEGLADDGRIRFYGAATWNGFRQKSGGGLSLERMVDIAAGLRGPGAHRFRFIQLPYSLAMPEALTLRDAAGRNILERARSLGVTVVTSAALLQSRLAQGLPLEVVERLPGFETDAQRAIQFARSAPGITVALTGMGRPSHVASNLGIAKVAPATIDQYLELFR